MHLNLKNPRTVEAVRSLARATGESVTAAVTGAIEEKLARIAPRRPPSSEEQITERIAAIQEIQRSVREAFEAAGERPPTKQEVDAMMYDEHGLPH